MAEENILQKLAGYVGTYAPGIATLLAATGVGAPAAAAVGALGALAKSFGMPEDAKPEERAKEQKERAEKQKTRKVAKVNTSSTPTLSPSQKKQKELWAEHEKARKEYYKAQSEGDKTPPHKDPKFKAMFDTQKKATDYQLSQ